MAIGVKAACVVAGAVLVLFSVLSIYGEFGYLAGGSSGLGMGDVVAVLAMFSLAFSASALIAQLPESLRSRFRRLPMTPPRRPVYGFGTMVAMGVGATLGSPLFILIPLNIEQYEAVSLLSLVLATIFSVGMAKVYADLGRESKDRGAELVGSPSFVKVATGARSVRYFVSRVSMWVANTALAAYTKIVFLIFDFVFLPGILTGYGIGSQEANAVAWTVALAFVGWTVLNIFYEERYLRAMGAIQITLTATLLILMVYHSAVLGSAGGWDLNGLLKFPGGMGWVPALIINTGYLYLLFFGFQEIQVFERDSVERSGIPLISRIKKGYALSKTTYFELAMIVSVVVAAAVNILYAVAVYSGGRSIPSLQTSCSASSCIPALYLAQNVLKSGGQELLIAAAFLIATVTTFVPAFLAATRHLGTLGEDGYMPYSLARLSWLFTLVAVLLLALGNQDFLVEVTDVMVLVSLGVVALSGLSLGKKGRSFIASGRALSLVIGLGCFLFGGALYFSSGGGSVVIFGFMAVLFAYLAFDIIELGSIGAQLFLSVLGFVSIVALALFGSAIHVGGFAQSVAQLVGVGPTGFILYGLLLSSALLAANVVLDVGFLRRKATG